VLGGLLLLVLLAAVGRVLMQKDPWELDQIPRRVTGSDEVARRAVPGWVRAEEQGLVVAVGVTEPVRSTEAAITIEKAWYSARQIYMLYTVTAPKGEYIVPTGAFLWPDAAGEGDSRWGTTDWTKLRQWGGFSRAGFHGVLVFDASQSPVGSSDRLRLEVRDWAPVSPESGVDTGRRAGRELVMTLPWRPDYAVEPAPEVVSVGMEKSWLGRTLAVERLEVSIGRTRLTGWIRLPEGERDPRLGASLRIGNQVLELKEFRREPGGAAGVYRFTATFDGPNHWPAPVKLDLSGIGFETDRTLEWPVPYAKYSRDQRAELRLMDQADRVTVPFYDSSLTSILTWAGGVSVEQKDPTGRPPYVRASLEIGGRGMGPLDPGFEVWNEDGRVITNMGGGGGNIWSDGRQGVSVNWEQSEAEGFRWTDRLVLRYVQPGADMVLKETWDLVAP
jgi:hypothetical protein